MATGFVNQFTTGRPYVNPTVAIEKPQMKISIPRPPEDKNPTEDPQEPKNPTENPNTKPVSEPKTTGQHGFSWGNLGKYVGIGAGAVGTGIGVAKGLGRTAESVGETGLNLGTEGLELGAQGIKNGADIAIHEAPSVGKNLLNWGEDALKGIETGAKSTNSFLESTSNGGGLVNSVQGTGKFAPGGGDVAPETSGLKLPDSWNSIGTDLSDLAKGDFSLAA